VTGPKRREVELSVEREFLDPSGGTRAVRLSARFDLEGARASPTSEELGDAIRTLERELGEAATRAGLTGPAARRDRELGELVDTYRPRQVELVDALESDGELTEREAALLRASLAAPLPRREPAPAEPVPREEPPLTDRPLAAMPLANDRTPATPRPVAELLSTYHIESLRQAGAVRARRQISFEEYMALKRHFAVGEGSDAPPDRGR